MEADCCYLNRGLVIGCRVMRAAAEVTRLIEKKITLIIKLTYHTSTGITADLTID